MKTNAVVVASIMFAASAAANRAADQTPSLAQQYDPAYRVYHADSSERGGSNEARGYRRNTKTERAPRPIDPLVQADSSIRGGSKESRSQNQFFGGSLEIVPEESLIGSANWNPSDDLLPDGTENRGWIFSNDASVGGAAVSESGSGFSNSILDDIAVPPTSDAWTLIIIQPTIIPSVEPSGKGELNSSDHLEKNISGQFTLDNQPHQSAIDPNSSTAVGGPGSTQTGTSSSSPEAVYNQSTESSDRDPGDNSQTSRFLFRNNRAQGVGSTATGDFATIPSSDEQLAQRVKSTLVHETTGTFGLTQSQVNRDIQISSHDGTVTLKGTVPTAKDKRLVEIRTHEVSGVSKVDNQLTVMAAPEPALRDLKIGRDLEDTTDQLKKLNEHQE